MNADHLSYQRATSVSIIGLVVQIVLGLTLLIYGIFESDALARSGSFVVFFGAPIWIALALVFHQHKRERLETMENASFRTSGAAGASVFGDEQTAETIQADKLAWMHRFFLPAVSLILAACYITTGLLRFSGDVKNYVRPDTFKAPESGPAIAIGVALLVVCFILARFVAGMAKQKVWSLLHAGAAASVGAALVGALLLISHGLELGLSFDKGLRYGPVIIDALMIFLGAEIILNFILTLYRPRKAGDYLRPAFDSRLLAFLAAPDRLAESVSDAINYQLGFDVSSTWFYRLISRSLLGLGVLTLVIMWGMTCFSVVQPDERGLLISGGEFVRELESGTVIKKPWPFASVKTYPAAAVGSFTVGLPTIREDASKARLWTDANPAANRFMLVQAGFDAENPGDARALALLIGEVPVQYRVNDLYAYLNLAQDGPLGETESLRHDVLRAEANTVVTQFFLQHTVEDLLGPRRAELEAELITTLQAKYDTMPTAAGHGAGVEVIFAGLLGIRPPTEIASAFEAVDASTYHRDASVEFAEAQSITRLSNATGDIDLAGEIVEALEILAVAKERIGSEPSDAERTEIVELERAVDTLLQRAGGEAAVRVTRARAERWQRALGQRAKAVLAEGQAAGFRAAPGPYQVRLYIEALSDSIGQARVWISPLELVVDIDNTEINTDITGLGTIETAPAEGQE